MTKHLCFFSFPERNWNMWVPGYGTEDFKQSKKLGSTEAHKQVNKDKWYILKQLSPSLVALWFTVEQTDICT